LLIKNILEKFMSDILKIRNQLNKWMDDDDKYNDPTARQNFQNKVWPFIVKHMDVILIDSGEKNNGDWPSSAFAAWLLVQHMDAFPQRQQTFLKHLTTKIPRHVKFQFLKDRSNVNQWILANYTKQKYFYNGKKLINPTVNVRNPKLFADAGIRAKSRQEALDNAIKAGNLLLVDAVLATRAKTQPSYTQS